MSYYVFSSLDATLPGPLLVRAGVSPRTSSPRRPSRRLTDW